MTAPAFDTDHELRNAVELIRDRHGLAGLDSSQLVDQLVEGHVVSQGNGSLLRAAAAVAVAGLLVERVARGDAPADAIDEIARILQERHRIEFSACVRVVTEYARVLGLITPPPQRSRARKPARRAVPGARGGGPVQRPVPVETQVPVDLTPVPAVPAPVEVSRSSAAPTSTVPTSTVPVSAGPVPTEHGNGGAAMEAVRKTLRQGLLALAMPDRMRQGRRERVEVGIARTTDSADAMLAGLSSPVRLSEQVNTSDYMQVDLVGDGFTITALSPANQLITPNALWQFAVVPNAAGKQPMTVVATCWVPVEGSERAVAVPAFERVVDVEVDVMLTARKAITKHWQWIVGTVIGLGGAIAAWISLFSDAG